MNPTGSLSYLSVEAPPQLSRKHKTAPHRWKSATRRPTCEMPTCILCVIGRIRANWCPKTYGRGGVHELSRADLLRD